ncbi:MAG: N-carbamoyl-D-amino-acid hydrolase [Gemmataceae bacterium]|nr:N-carbamoyl-D-amino-acid hydrolase [Gemmataceae bacterium]
MPRPLTVAAAQMGPVGPAETRAEVVRRLTDLLRQAHARGAELVVFPECALVPFFPHWWIADEAELDSYFEADVPNDATRPLFEAAARLGVGFCLGFAERADDGGRVRRFNTSVLVQRDGRVVGKYRKVHLPGHAEHRPANPFQNLEKRYFEVGNLGFPAWPCFGGTAAMLICNDRRWPEAWRCAGLAGAELVAVGYNTPRHFPEHPETDRLADFHHLLSLQAGAYQNGLWVVAAGKAGFECGVEQIGSSAVVAPSGEVVAVASTVGDEVVTARIDLDVARSYRDGVWNLARNRRPEHYGAITAVPVNG